MMAKTAVTDNFDYGGPFQWEPLVEIKTPKDSSDDDVQEISCSVSLITDVPVKVPDVQDIVCSVVPTTNMLVKDDDILDMSRSVLSTIEMPPLENIDDEDSRETVDLMQRTSSEIITAMAKNVSVLPCSSKNKGAKPKKRKRDPAVKVQKKRRLNKRTVGQKQQAVMMTKEYISSLYEDEQLSDVIIETTECCHYAHKVILSAVSPTLRSSLKPTLQVGFMGGEKYDKGITYLDFSEYDNTTVERMLQYVYKDAHFKLKTFEEAIDLYNLSCKYDINNLRKLSTDYFIKNLNLENALSILLLAYKQEDEDFKLKAIRYFENHWRDIVNLNELPRMSDQNPGFLDYISKYVNAREVYQLIESKLLNQSSAWPYQVFEIMKKFFNF